MARDKAPIAEPIVQNGKMSPAWQRWFLRILNPAIEEIDSYAPMSATDPMPSPIGTVDKRVAALEQLIYQIAIAQRNDLVQRIEQLERYIYQLENAKSYDKKIFDNEVLIYADVLNSSIQQSGDMEWQPL